MSMSDPIADMLTRIRNAQIISTKEVYMPISKVKQAILSVLKKEGYIKDFRTDEVDGKPRLIVKLKYHEGKPVISRIKRVSRPGLRIYRAVDDLPRVLNGLGVAIISTSQGIMSDREARINKQGGEVLCVVE